MVQCDAAHIVIGVVGLGYSLVCFYLFCKAATAPPTDDSIRSMVKNAVPENKAESFNVAPIDLEGLGKFLAAVIGAFKGAAPTILTLTGALLFLILSGVALDVYQVTGTSAASPADARKGSDRPKTNGNGAGGNVSDPAPNSTAPADNVAPPPAKP